MKLMKLTDATHPIQIHNNHQGVLKVYHSCSISNRLIERFKNSDKNIHAGSLIQAIWRADYKVNDEQVYPVAFVHEITFKLGRICPELVHDLGHNVDQIHEDAYKPHWDTLIYHNTGEGFANRQNLSVIILNKLNILSTKLHSTWDADALSRYEKLHFC